MSLIGPHTGVNASGNSYCGYNMPDGSILFGDHAEQAHNAAWMIVLLKGQARIERKLDRLLKAVNKRFTTMNPKIKELLVELHQCAYAATAGEMCMFESLEQRPEHRAASILQAVFDPENQPSQYGTVLFREASPGSKPPS